MTLSEVQRRLRKAKESERVLARWLQKHDGPDPRWVGVMSSTGRVGHIANLQFDAISKTYVGENKNVKLPATLLKWWLQINDIAITQGKEVLLRIEPSNEVKNAAGGKRKIPAMHIITEERHAELLRLEAYAHKASSVLEKFPVDLDDMIEDEDE